MTKKILVFRKLPEEQIGHELAASNQYRALFIHYNSLDMPQMTHVFKSDAEEKWPRYGHD